MVDVRSHNRDAWNAQVDKGNPWTLPVSPEEVAAASKGQWKIYLTPSKPVPKEWFPPLKRASVLCLASGGGQQGPILAAAGADVTVFDNSPSQLARDLLVAQRDRLSVRLVEGDMRDLAAFSDEAFDLIVHPVSNVFVPDVRPVWKEAYRVLKPGGCLISGFDNPVVHAIDCEDYSKGRLLITQPLPFSEAETLTDEEVARRRGNGEALEFGHTLEDQIGGQVDAGFAIIGFYEDRYPPEQREPLEPYMATFIATRAYKCAETADRWRIS
jgi:SAM-dependent methyltransferase